MGGGREADIAKLDSLPPSQTGIDSKEEHDNAKAILLEMGEFFQIQVGAAPHPSVFLRGGHGAHARPPLRRTITWTASATQRSRGRSAPTSRTTSAAGWWWSVCGGSRRSSGASWR